jgi:hypothetical protein
MPKIITLNAPNMAEPMITKASDVVNWPSKGNLTTISVAFQRAKMATRNAKIRPPIK